MGIKLNPDKTEIGKGELPFTGQLVTSQSQGNTRNANSNIKVRVTNYSSTGYISTEVCTKTFQAKISALLRHLLSKNVEFS